MEGHGWQLASLASLVLSYFLALNTVRSWRRMFSQTAPYNRFVAMLAIYIGTSVAVGWRSAWWRAFWTGSSCAISITRSARCLGL